MAITELTTDGQPGHGGMAPTINGNFDWSAHESPKEHHHAPPCTTPCTQLPPVRFRIIQHLYAMLDAVELMRQLGRSGSTRKSSL